MLDKQSSVQLRIVSLVPSPNKARQEIKLNVDLKSVTKTCARYIYYEREN